jgi:hypothetical protein
MSLGQLPYPRFIFENSPARRTERACRFGSRNDCSVGNREDAEMTSSEGPQMVFGENGGYSTGDPPSA